MAELDLDGISFPQRDIWGALGFMNYLGIREQVFPSSECLFPLHQPQGPNQTPHKLQPRAVIYLNGWVKQKEVF